MTKQIASAVVIPAFDAATTILRVIHGVSQHVPARLVIVVDDGSGDGTGRVAASAGATVLRHAKNKGKGAALRTGVEYVLRQTEVSHVVTIDADLQHPPERLPDFFEALERTGADIVIGARARRGSPMPIERRLSNALTSALLTARTGRHIRDGQCGYRLIGRHVLRRVHTHSDGYEAETEFLIKAARCGFRIEFVPIETIYTGERSHMRNWMTTVGFVKTLFRDY